MLKRPDILINKSVRDQQLKSEKPRTKWPEQAEPKPAENGADGKQAIGSLNSIAEQIERAMSGLIEQNLVKVRRDEFWLEVEINTNILFPSGDARLQSDAKPILDELARILRNFDNNIKVEGFTDNVPISNMIYPSNWELSAARAASVVNLLMRQGVRPTRMAAIGYGEFHPVTGNDTVEGRNKNRRVVLAVLENGASERVYDDKKFKNEASSPIPPISSIEVPVAITGAIPPTAPAVSAHVPVDVMSRDVTDRGIFTVIEPPIQLPSAFLSNVLPRVNRGLSGPGQGGG